MTEQLRDKIARALATQTTCDGLAHPSELHFRQADAVLAVIDLDDVRAEAWQKGWAYRADRAHLKRGESVPAPDHINPYRKAEQ